MTKSCKNKKKLRIAIACDILLDGIDTRANHMLELFNNLNKFSETYLFVPKLKEIKVILPNIKYVLWFDVPIIIPLLYQITLFFNLFIFCKKAEINVIYARQDSFTYSPLIVSKILNIPYVVEINGLFIEEQRIGGVNKRSIALTRFSEKINYRHATRIISVTQEIKNCIIQRYNIPDEKIVVIENGANTDLFRPINQEEARINLNLDQNSYCLCFVGTLIKWQGVDVFIRAAPLILKEAPNTIFLIVGEGMMKNELIDLSKEIGVYDKIIFTGSVDHKKVSYYINASDICISPLVKSIKGSPLKIFEYAACGKPIISSNHVNLDFLETLNIGILVEPENPINLATATLKLLKNESLRSEMGKNGRYFIAKDHSWKCVALKVFEVCRDAMNEGKNAY